MGKLYELTRKEYTDSAELVISDYTKVSITELADGYCDAEDSGDEIGKNGYFGALVLRFWSKIGKLKSMHPLLFPTYADALVAISESIFLALQKRVWRTNSNTNAEAIINQIIYTRYVVNGYVSLRRQKNGGRLKEEEGGGGVVLESLNQKVVGEDDLTLGDMIADDMALEDMQDYRTAIVQGLINNGKFVEAIIVDSLDEDVFRHKKVGNKETKTLTEFVPNRLICKLSNLDSEYVTEFANNYVVSDVVLSSAFQDIKNSSVGRKKKLILNCIKYLSRNSENYIY